MTQLIQQQPVQKKASLNNFDLIRLLAATQVALYHGRAHLKVDAEWLDFLGLSYFPGVPIFFFISGYLIYRSYANIKGKDQRLKTFFTNRALRIFPALYLCFFFSLLSVYAAGYFDTVTVSVKQFAVWVFTALTFFQFYPPEFLRGYGVGTLNGSLWTIAVELQFYIVTPLIFVLFNRGRKWVVGLTALFVAINLFQTFLFNGTALINKLFAVTFLPWIYMFLAGAYVSTNNALQKKILSVHPAVFLGAYVASYFLANHFHLGAGNDINFVSYTFLGCLIFRLAYTKPELSSKILRGNDISYGVYIYHMPIINFLIVHSIKGTLRDLLLAMVLTYTFAFTSWVLVEKRALNLKKIALRRYP